MNELASALNCSLLFCDNVDVFPPGAYSHLIPLRLFLIPAGASRQSCHECGYIRNNALNCISSSFHSYQYPSAQKFPLHEF